VSALGSPRRHLRRTGSTSDRGRELAQAGAPHGTLVTATEQTAGRGRQGRSWAAPPGQALLLSLVLRDWPSLLPLAAAVAVAEEVGRGSVIKWPNDVLMGDPPRKVAGILVEGRPQERWMVLGIGLNVALDPAAMPPDVRDVAGTLGRARDDVEPTLGRLLEGLERWLAAPAAQVLDAFRARDALAGREVSWAQGTGTAAGVDGEGRLVVRTASGEQRLAAGEVHLGAGR